MSPRIIASCALGLLLFACGGSDAPAPETTLVVSKTFVDVRAPTDFLSEQARLVSPVAFNGLGELVVGTSGGIYKYAAGVDPMSAPALQTFAGAPVHVIVASPADAQLLVALTEDPTDPNDAPAYLSTDGGATWTAATSFPTASGDTRWFDGVAYDPLAPQTLYATVEGGTDLAVSTDGGANWALVTASGAPTDVQECQVAIGADLSAGARRLIQSCGHLVATQGDHKVVSYSLAGPDPAVIGSATDAFTGFSILLRDFIGEVSIAAGAPARYFVGLGGVMIRIDGDGTSGVPPIVVVAPEQVAAGAGLQTRAVWADPSDRDRALFGGGHATDDGTVLPLFRYRVGQTLERWQPDAALPNALGGAASDVEVEQILAAPGGGFLVVVSYPASPDDGHRYLGLFTLAP